MPALNVVHLHRRGLHEFCVTWPSSDRDGLLRTAQPPSLTRASTPQREVLFWAEIPIRAAFLLSPSCRRELLRFGPAQLKSYSTRCPRAQFRATGHCVQPSARKKMARVDNLSPASWRCARFGLHTRACPFAIGFFTLAWRIRFANRVRRPHSQSTTNLGQAAATTSTPGSEMFPVYFSGFARMRRIPGKSTPIASMTSQKDPKTRSTPL